LDGRVTACNERSTQNWSALNIFSESFETVLRKNPENALFVCGNNLDLETLLLLKKVGQSLGVSVISENFLNTNQDLMSLSKSNVTFADLLDADLCLTVGTNVRFEASLLNVRLKKRARQGNFVKASIGLTENSTYQNDSIGTSIKTVLEIAEGKHMFCQKLTKAKNPVIILGSGVRSRLDSESITSLVQKLSKYCNVISDDWLGLGFIPLTSNVVGKSLIGMNSATNLNLKNKTFVYCVGLDSYENLLSRIDQNTSFIVAQTPFSNASLKKANLILPSTTFTEKQGTFVNLEGRIQSTTPALVGPSLAKNDFEIVKVLLAPYLSVNVTYSFKDESLSIADNKRSFIKVLVGVSKNNKKKVFKTPFKAVLSNFFSSNAITKNSIIMSKCASVFKKNYFNFI
jgi:NADH dehydrogenase/NADH:ubiquinone oxidoreductase subunit G